MTRTMSGSRAGRLVAITSDEAGTFLSSEPDLAQGLTEHASAVTRNESARQVIVAMFTRSDCHHLALRINALTGWQIAAGSVDFADIMDVEPSVNGRYPDGHAVVRHPNGQLLDVTGLNDDTEEFWDQYDCEFSIDVSPSDFLHWNALERANDSLTGRVAEHLVQRFTSSPEFGSNRTT